MAHILKHKGDVGVTKAIADATFQKWNVSIPLAEHLSYDLILEKNGITERVQVRYTTASKGCLHVKLTSSWSSKSGNHIKNRQKDDFDILAVYCPDNDQVYYVRSKEFQNGRCLSLRLISSKNNQKKGIRMADQFKKL